MPFRNLQGVYRCRFEKGSYLIRTGEEISYVYYLIKGEVYRKRITEDGHESVEGTKSGGSVVQSLVGILLLYRSVDRNIAYNDFVAAVDCECYCIPREVCREYLRNHPELLEDVVMVALETHNNRARLSQAKERKNTGSYLCRFLLEQSVQAEGERLVPKAITNEKMAKFLSVHYTTVSRILRTLKEDGAIKRTNQGLVIKDATILERYANSNIELKYKS